MKVTHKIAFRELQMTTDGVYTISILLDSFMDTSHTYCSICHVNKEQRKKFKYLLCGFFVIEMVAFYNFILQLTHYDTHKIIKT